MGEYVHALTRALPRHDTRGGGVRARAHACVALGRCVAFGRPKISVWGHAGARSAFAKVACISFRRPFSHHSQSVSFVAVPLRSPHLPKLSLVSGWGSKCTRSLVRCHRLKGRLRSPRSTIGESKLRTLSACIQMLEQLRRPAQPGAGGVVIEFGWVCYQDTYPDVAYDVACVYHEGYTYPDAS